MKGRILNIVLVLVLVALPMTANAGRSETQQATDQALPAPSLVEESPTPDAEFNSSPVMFIENAGQWDDGARFQVWGGPAGTMWLAEDAIWITVLEARETSRPVDRGPDPAPRRSSEDQEDLAPQRGVNIKLSFVGANPHPRLETFDRLDTTVSYFLGNDPEQWRPAVPVWGGVRYLALYPGIDLEVTGEDGRLAPRVIAAAGADLSALQLRVEGAEEAAIEGAMLRLHAAGRDIAWPLLQAGEPAGAVAVQPRGAGTFDIALPFAPSADASPPTARPETPADNPADLLYSTFLGGSSWDQGNAIAVDGTDRAYVTGETYSTDFPTTPGAFDRSHNGNDDTFVVKLNPAGSALAYATFLGGSELDVGQAIAVDGMGSAYVAGYTASSDFPTTLGAFDRSYNGGDWDAFVVKLNPAGSGLAYATFLGGSGRDYGDAIAVDGTGRAYVTGLTGSTNFPTTPGAFDRSHNGGYYDAFVVKLNPAGSALAYATFLGGSGWDYGSAIAVDGTGRAYVTGETTSTNFPTTPGAFDRSHNGNWDAFVVKLNPAGSGLAFATFLGGSGVDRGRAIAVDGTGSAYVKGYAYSSNFPTTPGAFDRSYNGNSDAFVVKLNPASSGLAYATFLGGSDDDFGSAIAVDGTGSAYVMGYTMSSDFPTTPGAFDRSHNGNRDAFVVKLNPAGSGLAYATFLGSSESDSGYTIAVDGTGSAYVAGDTASTNFPTTPGAFDRSYNGGYSDAFVARLAMGGRYAPTPNGYGFENSAAHTSWEIFRDTFGAENVEWTIGGVTVAKPEAVWYYFNHYKCDNPLLALTGRCTETGAGGNCSGMATSSMLLFKGWADPVDFLSQQGVNRVVDLPAPSRSGDFWQSSDVADFIVRYQGYQEGRQVKAAKVAAGNQNVSEALNLVKMAIDGGLADPQVISIWGPYDSSNAANPNHPNAECAGHALMPYAYAEDGAATRVYVYDSNHDPSSPYNSSQFVTFTPSTNTWRYEHHRPIGVWQSGQGCKLGALTSFAELKVAPLSAWKEHPIPPWGWAGYPTASAPLESGWYELAVSSNASLQAIDSLGRVVGNRNGTLALEIPGSALWIPTDVTPGITPSHTEQYIITSSSQLTLKMSYEESGIAVLDALVPEGVVAVIGASAVAGATDTVLISPDARQISVQAGSSGGGRSVTTTRDEDTFGREITIDGFLLTPGASAEVQARTDGAVSFASSVMQPSYGIKLRQAGAVSSMYAADGPLMMADDVHVIRLNWNNPTTATIEIDHGGDGTVDETRVLPNQVRKIYVPLVFHK